ncbi:MAG: hypothetical protein HY841_05600 [Bacteroidetes bacterium]|nr:hypothetical protein [Bacteroidota bacterium]
MKTKIFIATLTVGLFLTAFKFVADTKSSATVDQKEGIYIFMFSKPTAEYQFLGTVKKTGLVWSGKPAEMFNILLRRCKKDYPQADGLIFSDVDMDHADCVKFK